MALPHFDLPERDIPLQLIWPVAGNPVAMLSFETPQQWRAFVAEMALDPAIPDPTRLKFERALKLFLLGWLDADLMKGAELIALTALELALKDQYGRAVPPISARKVKPGSADPMMANSPRHSFKALLRHMVEKDRLTDDLIPMIVRCGGKATGQLIGEVHPTLDERRNAMAHGDPFDGMPTSGLVELVRDLITYAYRGHLADKALASGEPPSVHPACNKPFVSIRGVWKHSGVPKACRPLLLHALQAGSDDIGPFVIGSEQLAMSSSEPVRERLRHHA